MNVRLLIIAVCLVGIGWVLGARFKDARLDTTLPEWAPDFGALPLPPVGERRLAAHWTHALALKDGRLYGWGGDGGQGFSGARREAVEAPVVLDDSVGDWRFVGTGISASYAVTAAGDLLRRPMWVPPGAQDAAPRHTRILRGVAWVKARELLRTTMALDSDGALYVWSEREFEAGRLCFDAPDACADFDPVAADSGKALAWRLPRGGPWADFCLSTRGADRYHAFALDRHGKLYRIEFEAQRSARHREPRVALAALAAPAVFQRVYCAEDLGGPVLALDAERRLWGFGDNGAGAVDPALKQDEQRKGVFPYVIAPTAMRRLSSRRWLDVAPGAGYTVAIASDGSLWAWGDEYARSVRRVGEGPAAPWLVDDTRRWLEVAAAGGYLIARDEAGGIHTWGASRVDRRVNPYVRGLLGDGGVAEHRDQPRPVAMPP